MTIGDNLTCKKRFVTSHIKVLLLVTKNTEKHGPEHDSDKEDGGRGFSQSLCGTHQIKLERDKHVKDMILYHSPHSEHSRYYLCDQSGLVGVIHPSTLTRSHRKFCSIR